MYWGSRDGREDALDSDCSGVLGLGCSGLSCEGGGSCKCCCCCFRSRSMQERESRDDAERESSEEESGGRTGTLRFGARVWPNWVRVGKASFCSELKDDVFRDGTKLLPACESCSSCSCSARAAAVNDGVDDAGTDDDTDAAFVLVQSASKVDRELKDDDRFCGGPPVDELNDSRNSFFV